MSDQMNLLDLLSAISSPALASGPTPCAEQDGPMIVLYGQDRVRASLSARQAKGRGLMMSGTCGPRSTTSSASAALTLSLVNRLQAKTALVGSTLYSLTWKQRATPAGRSISALRASVRRTSVSASGGLEHGWATPTTRDHKDTGNLETSMHRQSGQLRDDTVPRQAWMTGWPTPQMRDSRSGGEDRVSNPDRSNNLNDFVLMAGWPTPTVTDAARGIEYDPMAKNMTLNMAAARSGWPTSAASDADVIDGISLADTAGAGQHQRGLCNGGEFQRSALSPQGEGRSQADRAVGPDEDVDMAQRYLSSGPTNGHWRDADWLFCRDGKWRPVEPGTSPLAHGASDSLANVLSICKVASDRVEEYANRSQTNPSEILRMVREHLYKETGWEEQPTGMRGKLYAPEVLLTFMLSQTAACDRATDSSSVKKAGKETVAWAMHIMRMDGGFVHSSHQRRPNGQQRVQSANPLHELSFLLACDAQAFGKAVFDAHAALNRVGMLRGYGNAIVAQAAQAFIESVM